MSNNMKPYNLKQRVKKRCLLMLIVSSIFFYIIFFCKENKYGVYNMRTMLMHKCLMTVL